jgi:hypothetical protein
MLQVKMKIRTVLRSWDERLRQSVTKQRLRVSLRLLLLQVLQMLLLSPYISLVCGVHDIEVVENLVDVLAKPWALVALRSGRFLFIARAIPVGVSIVNLNVCRLARRRGVGVSVGFSGGCAQVALSKE